MLLNNAKVTIAATAGLAVLLTACGSNKTTERASQSNAGGQVSTAPAGTTAKQADMALVRFINSTPDAKTVYFGDSAAFTGVASQQVTPYKQLPAERREFALYMVGGGPAVAASNNTAGSSESSSADRMANRAPGANRSTGTDVNGDKAAGTESGALATNSEGLSAGKHYTLLAVNDKNGKTVLKAINDDLTPPKPGKAKIRVIQADSHLGDVDVFAQNGDKIISGAGFDDATGYKEVEPTLTHVNVRRQGSKKDELKISDLKLGPDKMYTIVLMGANNKPMVYEVVEDQLIGNSGNTGQAAGQS